RWCSRRDPGVGPCSAVTFPVPTRRLAIAAALASLLVLVGPAPWPALLVVDGLLLLVALADWLLALPPQKVGVERDLPGVVPLGQEVELVWRVRNPADRKLRGTLADELFPSLP